MNKTICLVLMGLIWTILANAEAQTGKSVKKKVKYKKHTQLDFSGNKVQGKIKAPAVFYIFQRKRADEHRAIRAPKKFLGHKDATIQLVAGEIGN